MHVIEYIVRELEEDEPCSSFGPYFIIGFLLFIGAIMSRAAMDLAGFL